MAMRCCSRLSGLINKLQGPGSVKEQMDASRGEAMAGGPVGLRHRGPRILQVVRPQIFFADLGANLEPAEDTAGGEGTVSVGFVVAGRCSGRDQVMKIFAYKVVPDHEDTRPFEETLAECAARPLPERLTDHGSVRLRLEDFRRRNRLVEMNFVSLRLGSAPVRVAEDRPAAEITIDDDEFFGEETACLYDPASAFW